ncbi:MAG: methylated-DNA--[protein]-cysteine S-methyltransferase [Thiogranum sp.]|nr:methylated-DNA--[protein]-cysteine S-methyltransferase [Thiogranum sp.]
MNRKPDILTACPLLRDRHSILASRAEAERAEPVRLHDQFIMLKQAGQNAGSPPRIVWGLHATPFGDMLLAATGGAICWLAFIAEVGVSSELERLQARWRDATFAEGADATAALAAQVFAVQRCASAPLQLEVRGTDFQVRVWRALLNIPAGAVASYQALADSLGSASASRAVASAIARNPVGYLVPCHRIIRSDGDPGGFRWGINMKRMMLEREATLSIREYAAG